MGKKFTDDELDNLIKEAITEELNEIDVPPSKQVWERIYQTLYAEPHEEHPKKTGSTKRNLGFPSCWYCRVRSAACRRVFFCLPRPGLGN